jgi:hypothetical protein
MAQSFWFGRSCPITFHRYVLIHRNVANIFRITVFNTLTKGINRSYWLNSSNCFIPVNDGTNFLLSSPMRHSCTQKIRIIKPKLQKLTETWTGLYQVGKSEEKESIFWCLIICHLTYDVVIEWHENRSTILINRLCWHIHAIYLLWGTSWSL